MARARTAHQNDLRLRAGWRAEGAFALRVRSVQMLTGHLSASYLQHHKSWGPRGRGYRQSSLLLLPSSSDQGIYPDGEDYSRQTLRTPSENRDKVSPAGEALDYQWRGPGLGTRCAQYINRLSADLQYFLPLWVHTTSWEAMRGGLKSFFFLEHSGLWNDYITQPCLYSKQYC